MIDADLTRKQRGQKTRKEETGSKDIPEKKKKKCNTATSMNQEPEETEVWFLYYWSDRKAVVSVQNVIKTKLGGWNK